MKTKFFLLIIFAMCLSASAHVKCYIKVGFGDCINCFNMLSLVEDFDKEYIFKNEFKGLEKEILKEYLGITEPVTVHTSDSFYEAFGYDNFTVLSFCHNGKEVFKCPMSGIDKCLPDIRRLNHNEPPVETHINLGASWHEKCQVKITEANDIIILDPLLNKLHKMDEEGKMLQTLASTKPLIENIYKTKFGENNTELNAFYGISKAIGNRPVAVNFNTVSVSADAIYVLTTGHYFIINTPDTIFASFSSIIKINNNFEYQVINYNSEVKPEYFLSQGLFQFINDSTILFDLISTNPRNKTYIIAENVIRGNQLVFKGFYNDTIPENLVIKQLNYRVTGFSYDNGFVTYAMFNGIYQNSQSLPNCKLFKNYRFGPEMPNPKNFMTGIKSGEDVLYVSYQIDSFNFVATYNLKEQKMQSTVFSVRSDTLTTFLQLDKPGFIYYVNKEKNLVRKKI
jgi:hypothetical protein